MKMTRDSIVWWVGMVLSVLAASAANLDLLPALLVPAKEWIVFISVVAAAVTGKMATSPLKGEND